MVWKFSSRYSIPILHGLKHLQDVVRTMVQHDELNLQFVSSQTPGFVASRLQYYFLLQAVVLEFYMICVNFLYVADWTHNFHDGFLLLMNSLIALSMLLQVYYST